MTAVKRTSLLRDVERLARGAARRAGARLRASARPPELRVELLLDGAGLLNWRGLDASIDAIRLLPGAVAGKPGGAPGGAPVDSPRREAEGPSHGVLELSALEHQHYVVRALRGGRARRISLQEDVAMEGTRNIAVTPDGRVWDVTHDPARGAVLRSRGQAEALRGVSSLRATHGMVTLAARPTGAEVTLQLERRSTKEILEVLPTSRDEQGTAQFRIGAEQWAEVVRGSEEEGRPDSLWNLYLIDPAAPSRRERLRWTGSSIRNPRETLRYRATASLMIPGKKVEIRPYWTKDQFLALEVNVTTSIQGELV